jgi:hypothetical protein
MVPNNSSKTKCVNNDWYCGSAAGMRTFVNFISQAHVDIPGAE